MRKTFGCLRDLMRVKTVGVIEENKAKGLVKYAKPVGVVGAVSPSTNPAATPVNKAMFAIKGKNAVIVAPSPAGMKTTTMTVDYMRAELKKVGAPEDLVQVLPAPVNKELTQRLMEAVDRVMASQEDGATPLKEVALDYVRRYNDGWAQTPESNRRLLASRR